MATATVLKCKHCNATTNKAGKPFSNKGALALHEQKHCPEKPNSDSGHSELKTCCANPSVRLLRTNVYNELYVMHQGMTKVCDNCKECS